MNNTDNIKIVAGDYETMAKKENTIILDRDDIGDINIPPFSELLNDIIELLDYIGIDEIIQMEKNDPVLFNNHIREKFIYFEEKGNRSVFNILIDKRNRDANFDELMNMIATLQLVKIGKRDVKTEHEKFRDENDSRFVYPLYGGKDEFERKLKDQNKQKILDKIKNKRH